MPPRVGEAGGRLCFPHTLLIILGLLASLTILGGIGIRGLLKRVIL
jgi:hypothetical protein